MSDAIPEQWLPVVGFEGYYDVSSHGRVRSLPRRKCRGRILKPQPLPAGYLQVNLSVSNVRYTRSVHTLVMRAFEGPCPPGEEVRHLDGNPANNRRSNLAYGTHDENAQDMIRHGRTRAGTRHYRSILTDADVDTIRAAHHNGSRVTDLARQYHASKAAISRIVNGLSYITGAPVERAPELCHFPGCGDRAEDGTDSRGRSLKFCERLDHNSRMAARERQAAPRRGRTADCAYCEGQFPQTRSDKIYCSERCLGFAKRQRKREAA